MQHNKRISNIHSLRGFAALLVVLFHVNLNTIKNGFSESTLHNIFSIGNSGVDIFFVISGFVMIISNWEKRISNLRFLTDRIKRIWPLYFVLTSLYYSLAVMLPSLFPNIKINLNWYLSSITFTSAISNYRAPILGQGWSLEYEMLFYLMFSITLFCRGNLKKIILLFGLVLLGVILGISTLFFEFAFGMLAGYLFRQKRVGNLQGLLIAILGFLLIFLSSLSLFLGIDRTLIYGIPSFMIIFGLSCTKQVDSRIMKKLGDSSYSLYLSQFFIIPFIFKFSGVIQGLVSNSTILVIMVSGATLVFGHVVYLLVEKPLTNITNMYFLPK